MAIQRWDQQFVAITGVQVVTLLWRAGRTVDELADDLDLTDNAIRTHLAAHERDGLVQQQGEWRERAKPSLA